MVFFGFSVAILTSCTHDPTLDEKIEAEAQKQPVINAQSRAQEAEKTIDQAPLTNEQKAKLENIAQAMNRDLKKLRDEEAQLRLLLVKQLMNPEATDREIEGIKRRILDRNQEANKRWISALDESRQIIGRRNELDARFYRAFMQEPKLNEGAAAIN